MTTEEYIQLHRGESITKLALSISRIAGIDGSRALRQIEGWQRLRMKVPTWASCEGIEYPPRLSLEQCSGESAARYKADIVRRVCPIRNTMADLTGGLGIDFSFLAPLFRCSSFVERKESLVALARHNLPILGVRNADFIEMDAASYLQRMCPVDLLYLDPARRDGSGNKIFRITDCEPNVVALLSLLRQKSTIFLLKLSPMLDLKEACSMLESPMEAHVFADGGECKELVFVLGKRPPVYPTTIYCADGIHRFMFTFDAEASATSDYTADIKTGNFLYEPSPALLKAGAYRLLATQFRLAKLHPNSHLYISGTRVANFPGRQFVVLRSTGFKKQELRTFINNRKRANLTIRNFPMGVSELRHRLRMEEGGDEYWFATTLADGQHRIIACRKI